MRKWLALGVQIPFIAMMWVACSGDTGNGSDAGDSSVQDVKADKKAPIETGVVDTGTGACTPETTIDAGLTFVPPAQPQPTACSDAQIAGLYSSCFDSNTATQAKCTAFEGAAANSACVKCMFSTFGQASAYGTLIAVNGVDYANTSGCIAIEMNDTSATGCGAKEQAVLNCEVAACDTCSKITDTTTYNEWISCTQAADNGVCKPYVDAVCNLADAGAEGGTAYTVCLNHSAFADYYNAIAPVFCGGYPADAGTDGGGTDSGTTDSGTTDAGTDAPVDAPDDGG